MNEKAEKCLFVRDRTHAHGTTLANASKTSALVSTLLRKIYAHQPAVYSKPLHSDEDTTTKIAKEFYTNHYIAPQIHRGTTPLGNPVTVTELVDEVVLSNITLSGPTRNRLSYLIGSVGSGKTAFINYLITQHGHNWPKRAVWFIRIDVETAAEGDPIDCTTLVKQLIRKTLRIFREFPELQQKQEGKLEESLTSGLSYAVEGLDAKLIKVCETVQLLDQYPFLCEAYAAFCHDVFKVSGMRPFIIFDNLDYIAHLLDRQLFTENGIKADQGHAKQTIHFIESFYHEAQRLGRLGASVLFVMRCDTYEMLSKSLVTSLPEQSTAHDLQAYLLTPPHWIAVLEKRNQLLVYASNLTQFAGTARDVQKLINLLQIEFVHRTHDRRLTLLDRLHELSNHGLRQLMSFVIQYGWLHGAGHSEAWMLLERMAQQHPVALVVFMLGGKCRFSQLESHFPNIYLVNAPEIQHEHTYWLKRLIIDFVVQRDRRNEVSTPEQIYSVFSGEGRYARDLVEICLGSLISVNTSNLLQPIRYTYPTSFCHIDKVVPTPRCLYCYDTLFGLFVYLQLIVEDDRLPIPRVLERDFSFSFNTRDYSYLVTSDIEEFTDGAEKMIAEKALRVFHFICVLQVSLEYESKRYKPVFDSLIAQGITIPPTRQLSVSVLKEIQALRDRLKLNFPDDFQYLSKVTALREQIGRLYV